MLSRNKMPVQRELGQKTTEDSDVAHPRKSYYHSVDSKYPICPYTLPEIYEIAANRDNGKGFIWHRPEEQMSHRDIYMKAMHFAKGLLALGLKRGDNAICFGSQGSDSLVMFVACSSLGIRFSAPYLYTPVTKQVEMCIRRLKPKVILLGNALSGQNAENVYQVASSVLHNRNNQQSVYRVPHIFHDKLSEIDNSCNTNQSISKSLSFLINAGESVTDAELKEAKSVIDMNEPTLYSTSSGTTGEPKLILVGAALFTNGGIRRQWILEATSESRYGTANMCTEDFGLLEEAVASFYVGYDVIVFPNPATYVTEEEVPQILETIEKHKPSMIYVDQWFTTYIINHPECRHGYDLSSLKGWILGGSPASSQFKMDALNVWPLTIDCYGLSENYYCTAPKPGENLKKPHTVGKPVPNTEVKIVDEKGRVVPLNSKGELLVRGYGLFIEYKDQPELTKSMVTSDGWLKTGDCAVMDDDHDLRIVGRMSTAERFKVGSDVVYAVPIENTLKENKKIKEAVVIGRLDPETRDHEISYCIIPFAKDSLSIKEVMDYAKRHMSSQIEWPIRVFFYEKFPRHGARAKISRRALLKDVIQEVDRDHKVGL